MASLSAFHEIRECGCQSNGPLNTTSKFLKIGGNLAKDANQKKLDFENKSRLLTDDEKELVKVLQSFHEAIQDLRDRLDALEQLVRILYHVQNKNKLDTVDS